LTDTEEAALETLASYQCFLPGTGANDEENQLIALDIEYEFKSRTLAMLMGAMFDTAFRRFAAAFETRADEVYGRKSA